MAVAAIVDAINSRMPSVAVTQSSMRVTKRDGSTAPVDLNKIVRAINRSCSGLPEVDAMRVATKTINGLYDGASTQELDRLSIQTAADLTAEEPQYSKLAARLLSVYIDKEVHNQDIQSFSQSIAVGRQLGLINQRLFDVATKNARKLNDAIVPERDREFEFFGLRTVYDRYLIKHPQKRLVIETPQQFFMRIAVALSESITQAIELYNRFSLLEYLPSSPTLFNAGLQREQLSSCFLLDSPVDSLEAIYDRYKDIALLSKYAGGIGASFSRVRSRGSLIRGTNGFSNGVVPFLKTLDASVSAIHQGGKRAGAACVYLETWHADIEEFLELRNNTGDEAVRTHNLHLANWIPDLFMQRVEADQDWSLFDPSVVPELPDLYADAFVIAYERAEREGLSAKTVKARDLYTKMLRTLAQTGNGWMTFKDAANLKSNQTLNRQNVIHSSNLCVEVVQVSNNTDETAVCNLGSINLARHIADGKFDFDKLRTTVQTAVHQLNHVIDLNFYTIPQAKTSNMKWRPIGLGLMGLQDVFFAFGWAFDSDEAKALSKQISEEIYFTALSTSCDLATAQGPHETFADTRAAQGDLQFDAWGVKPEEERRWNDLRERIKQHGLRNSLMIAIAPTATIASIVGCYECIEPQVSNLFKRETMSGDFMQVNRYLVESLKKLGLWSRHTRDRLKLAEGSVQSLTELPEDVRHVFRTAWEIPMRSLIDMAADRGAFIDQSQSLNLFVESPNIGALSAMYFHAWKRGLKTTYYLRSRAAGRTAKTVEVTAAKTTDEKALACSLANPESCEACQ